MNRYNIRKVRGFSLIELLIALAIIGILAAIAIPNYTDYLRKTRRADGKAALQTAAQAMERHFTENGSYTGATLAAFGLTTSSERYYNLTLTIPAGGATFTIDAAPTGAQADDPCGTLTVNQAGTRSVSGGSLTAAQCW